MITNQTPAVEKRAKLAADLKSGRLLQFPGAYNAMVAMLIEQQGFDGVYVSGAVMANSMGLPDIGFTTMTEVAMFASQIARRTSLPTIMDIDTGFGETMNVARCIHEIEHAGLSGCHLEDQVNPKRCGHLDNKTIVPVSEMVQKIQTAAKAKADPNFVVMARTDARASEGLEKTIDRAKAYVDAGADMIFPEAMYTEADFAKMREAISVPILANMTEFGKSKLLTTRQLTDLGVNMVLYPVTTQRLAMKAVEDGLKVIKEAGTQEPLLGNMQTRKRLYEVLKYEDYNAFDKDIYNFKLD
ncbi:MAG: methylisocitrate lyase [Arcticibacterium sp.]|jgi:methylisocitrate lyase